MKFKGYKGNFVSKALNVLSISLCSTHFWGDPKSRLEGNGKE